MGIFFASSALIISDSSEGNKTNRDCPFLWYLIKTGLMMSIKSQVIRSEKGSILSTLESVLCWVVWKKVYENLIFSGRTEMFWVEKVYLPPKEIDKLMLRALALCYSESRHKLRLLCNWPPSPPLLKVTINTYSFLREKLWLRGGVGGQSPRNLNWSWTDKGIGNASGKNLVWNFRNFMCPMEWYIPVAQTQPKPPCVWLLFS